MPIERALVHWRRFTSFSASRAAYFRGLIGTSGGGEACLGEACLGEIDFFLL